MSEADASRKESDAGPASPWGGPGETVALRPAAEREREERIGLIATLPRQRRRNPTGLLRPQRTLKGGTR